VITENHLIDWDNVKVTDRESWVWQTNKGSYMDQEDQQHQSRWRELPTEPRIWDSLLTDVRNRKSVQVKTSIMYV